MTITAEVHLDHRSRAAVTDCSDFRVLRIEPDPDGFSYVTMILPEHVTLERAQMLADAINAAIAAPNGAKVM
ncbi:MAG: hypothetical protein K2Y29_08040 [Beijerinckiaceae bacterium]|nr:hypothetical protein [Beijerinckiaceae bacterium]